MPLQIEHEGQKITAYTQEELDQEVKGLKVTNENLKAEKKEIADKLAEAKESVREIEEAKAKAEGDNETLRRIAEEREAEKREAVEQERKKFSDLLNMTKKEKVDNFLNDLVSDLGPADATRAKHLKKLLKADYDFDVDLEQGAFSVSGEGVTSVDDLKRHVKESSDYRYLLSGSGATGGGSAGGTASGAGVKNPFAKGENFNLTEQARILREDPALAAQLKAAAV